MKATDETESIIKKEYFFFSALTQRGPVQGLIDTKNRVEALLGLMKQGAVVMTLIPLSMEEWLTMDAMLKAAQAKPVILSPHSGKPV
jgi:hypothetical protein